MSPEECPGKDKCHGPLKWCDNCGDVKHICDMRLRDERCDAHPVPPTRPTLNKALELVKRDLRDAELALQNHQRTVAFLEEEIAARLAYDLQLSELEKKLFDVSREG